MNPAILILSIALLSGCCNKSDEPKQPTTYADALHAFAICAGIALIIAANNWKGHFGGRR